MGSNEKLEKLRIALPLILAGGAAATGVGAAAAPAILGGSAALGAGLGATSAALGAGSGIASSMNHGGSAGVQEKVSPTFSNPVQTKPMGLETQKFSYAPTINPDAYGASKKVDWGKFGGIAGNVSSGLSALNTGVSAFMQPPPPALPPQQMSSYPGIMDLRSIGRQYFA